MNYFFKLLPRLLTFAVCFHAITHENVVFANQRYSNMVKKSHIGYRDYQAAVKKSEKKDINFILKLLANKPLPHLLKHKSELQKAGDRIDHIHPLKFLTCVFTDEELKVYIHNLKRRGGWTWSDFIKGLRESLEDETNLNNMNEEFIQEFSREVNIDIGLIYPLIKDRRWDDFVTSLISFIPRKGDSGRYDM